MMVKVHFPQKTALKQGKAQWGDLPIELQEVLDLLTEGEREQLRVDGGKLMVAHDHYPFQPDYVQVVVDDVTSAGVVQSIRDVWASNVVKRADRVMEWQKVLDTPQDYLWPDGRHKQGYDSDDVAQACSRLGLDPAPYQNALDITGQRLAGAYKQAWCTWFDDWIPGIADERERPYHRNGHGLGHDRLEMRYAKEVATELGFSDVLQRIQVYQDAIAAQRAAEEEQAEKSRRAWRQWAVECGSEDLRHAIEEKYPLGQEVEREVEAAAFPSSLPVLVVVRTEVETASERRVPRQAARDLEAYLRDQIEATRSQLPDGADLVVGRICAVEFWAQCDCDEEYPCGECDGDHEIRAKRTAVPVHLMSMHHQAERWYVIEE